MTNQREKTVGRGDCGVTGHAILSFWNLHPRFWNLGRFCVILVLLGLTCTTFICLSASAGSLRPRTVFPSPLLKICPFIQILLFNSGKCGLVDPNGEWTCLGPTREWQFKIPTEFSQTPCLPGTGVCHAGTELGLVETPGPVSVSLGHLGFLRLVWGQGVLLRGLPRLQPSLHASFLITPEQGCQSWPEDLWKVALQSRG